MPATYFSVVTLLGQAQIAAAIANTGDVVIAQLAAGDGNGAFVTPVVTQTALVREVWRGAVTAVARDPLLPTHVKVTATIPSSVGPATIRELGLVAGNGELIAVANYPATDMAGPGQGALTDIDVEFVLVVDTAAPVTVQVNPAGLVYLSGLRRAPFISVDSIANSPPGSPPADSLVVIGAAPTGAFSGNAHKFAQWQPALAAWVASEAHLGTIIQNKATGAYMRRTADGWAAIDDNPFFCTAGGTANAITLSGDGSLGKPLALRTGLRALFFPTAANTGSVTIDAWGLGAKPLRSIAAVGLAANDLSPARPVEVIYSETALAGGAWLILPWSRPDQSFNISTVSFTSPGTTSWTCPAGVTRVRARVWGGSAFYVPLVGNGDVNVWLPRFPAAQRLRGEIIYAGPLKAPVAKGSEVARLRVTSTSNAMQEVPLYAAEDVGEGGLVRRGLDSLAHLAFRLFQR